MSEHDAAIRDLQMSVDRAQEIIADLQQSLTQARGTVRLLSLSMRMNSEERGLSEVRWQDACRWLARELAGIEAVSPEMLEMLAAQWIAEALQAADNNPDASAG